MPQNHWSLRGRVGGAEGQLYMFLCMLSAPEAPFSPKKKPRSDLPHLRYQVLCQSSAPLVLGVRSPEGREIQEHRIRADRF